MVFHERQTPDYDLSLNNTNIRQDYDVLPRLLMTLQTDGLV